MNTDDSFIELNCNPTPAHQGAPRWVDFMIFYAKCYRYDVGKTSRDAGRCFVAVWHTVNEVTAGQNEVIDGLSYFEPVETDSSWLYNFTYVFTSEMEKALVLWRGQSLFNDTQAEWDRLRRNFSPEVLTHELGHQIANLNDFDQDSEGSDPYRFEHIIGGSEGVCIMNPAYFKYINQNSLHHFCRATAGDLATTSCRKRLREKVGLAND